MQVGTQLDPDAVEARQGLYVVEGVSDGLVHGFGVHDPIGEEKLPSVHVRERDPPVAV